MNLSTGTPTRQESIQEYYGRVLSSTQDLKTNACCAPGSQPGWIREIARELHPEVTERFYGCGSPIPQSLEGCRVLDLGCGTGRDCFILSKLVGPSGKVIGVDMTEEQLAFARKHEAHHAARFGYQAPNTDFRRGFIEDLEGAGIASASVDVVVSNCVLNLSPDKERVFSEIFRVLKPGGELFFSDVFADRRVPAELGEDPVLVGECLAGALYLEDFRRLLLRLGIRDYRIASRSPILPKDPAIERKVGGIRFESITVRAFRLELEDRCEDYGQVATYLGSLPEAPHAFLLDDHHRFEAGRPLPVCSNTAAMLSGTRYARHFEVRGSLSRHFGLFDCGPSPAAAGSPAPGACC